MSCNNCLSANLVCQDCGSVQPKTRTNQQNKALHKWLTLLAIELNDAGVEYDQIINFDIPLTMQLLKELLVRPVINKMYNKFSTTSLSTKEFSELVEVLQRAITNKFGICVEFPNIDHDMPF